MQKRLKVSRPRIGIYAGAFDPVHAGHISFSLQAIDAAGLDQVIFLAERRPRDKPGVEHYAHRIAMLKAATAPHPDLAVMEMVDRHFTVTRTLPLLQSVLPEAELVFLMGSDTAATLPSWSYADRLVHKKEIVIGTRHSQAREGIAAAMEAWPYALAREVHIIESYAPDVSSTLIRHALKRGHDAAGLLASVRRYARAEWLYASPAHAAAMKH